MLNEEKKFNSRIRQEKEEKKYKDKLKKQNIQRTEQGKAPIYLKKTEVKQLHLKEKFEKLE